MLNKYAIRIVCGNLSAVKWFHYDSSISIRDILLISIGCTSNSKWNNGDDRWCWFLIRNHIRPLMVFKSLWWCTKRMPGKNYFIYRFSSRQHDLIRIYTKHLLNLWFSPLHIPVDYFFLIYIEFFIIVMNQIYPAHF